MKKQKNMVIKKDELQKMAFDNMRKEIHVINQKTPIHRSKKVYKRKEKYEKKLF